jgi:hypothetical protein
MVKPVFDSIDPGNPEDVFQLLSSTPEFEDFSSGLSIRFADPNQHLVLGLTDLGEVFLAMDQPSEVIGFGLKRASFEGNRQIRFGSSAIERAMLLRCFVSDLEEILAISSLFAGLIKLFLEEPMKALQAAQAYEDYFAGNAAHSVPVSEEVGLFGELCVIFGAKNRAQLVAGWHSSPHTTYDFSIGAHRLEVKTSRSPQRIHWLRNSQSGNHFDRELTYASVYSPESGDGVTVDELRVMILGELGAVDADAFSRKLEFFSVDKYQIKFDLETAISGIRYFSAQDVPAPVVDSSEIIDVQWKIDFSKLSGFEDAWLSKDIDS